MRNVVIFAVLALLITGGASRFADKFSGAPSTKSAGSTAKQGTTASRASSQDNNTMYVAADRRGHFFVNGVIGGRTVAFIVDTGASIVALTKEDADRLGITRGPRDPTMLIQTANGVTQATKVRLAGISIGPLTVQDVNAVVMPSGRLTESLLGMTFLSRLRRYEFRTGQLVMEQ